MVRTGPWGLLGAYVVAVLLCTDDKGIFSSLLISQTRAVPLN